MEMEGVKGESCRFVVAYVLNPRRAIPYLGLCTTAVSSCHCPLLSFRRTIKFAKLS